MRDMMRYKRGLLANLECVCAVPQRERVEEVQPEAEDWNVEGGEQVVDLEEGVHMVEMIEEGKRGEIGVNESGVETQSA